MHKLREAMTVETRDTQLTSHVEVDGAIFGGHVRPANAHQDRVDRRLLRNRSGKRRVVVALRQRGGRRRRLRAVTHCARRHRISRRSPALGSPGNRFCHRAHQSF